MGDAYDVELRCPSCGLSGHVWLRNEPSFAIEKLPPYFRVMQPADTPEDTKLACRCGQVFDLIGRERAL